VPHPHGGGVRSARTCRFAGPVLLLVLGLVLGSVVECEGRACEREGSHEPAREPAHGAAAMETGQAWVSMPACATAVLVLMVDSAVIAPAAPGSTAADVVVAVVEVGPERRRQARRPSAVGARAGGQ
jgi:hypothetical protein